MLNLHYHISNILNNRHFSKLNRKLDYLEIDRIELLIHAHGATCENKKVYIQEEYSLSTLITQISVSSLQLK